MLAVRFLLEVLVLGALLMWWVDLLHQWSTFARRARRVSAALMVVLLANGYAILVALYRETALSSGTWALLASYAVLNLCLLFRPANDWSTERQYAHLFARFRLRR